MAMSTAVVSDLPPRALDHARLPVPAAGVIFQRVPGGAVLLSTADEVYYGLNEVGAEVWGLLVPGTATLDTLCDALAATYPEVPSAELRADIAELLDSLEAAGLLARSAP